MEIPEINMISDFEAGMKCLQNPSSISRFFSIPGIEKVPRVYSFWKWGALIFAIFATFSSIIRRIKLVFIQFHTVKPSSNQYQEIIDFSEDDDISLASSDDEHEQGSENSPTTSFRSQQRVDDDFRVRGTSGFCLKNQWQNGNLRQRRGRNNGGAWSEFTSGKNVVKLWDSLGLSLDFDEDLFNYDSKSVVSTWDLDQDQTSSGFCGGHWNFPEAAPVTSATVVLTAEGNRKGDGVILGGYDSRMRRSVTALFAEWSSPAQKVAVVTTGGVGQVYVRDDVSGVLTVGDVRNVRKPLESVREYDGETWWDADAVIVENKFDEYT